MVIPVLSLMCNCAFTKKPHVKCFKHTEATTAWTLRQYYTATSHNMETPCPCTLNHAPTKCDHTRQSGTAAYTLRLEILDIPDIPEKVHGLPSRYRQPTVYYNYHITWLLIKLLLVNVYPPAFKSTLVVRSQALNGVRLSSFQI